MRITSFQFMVPAWKHYGYSSEDQYLASCTSEEGRGRYLYFTEVRARTHDGKEIGSQLVHERWQMEQMGYTYKTKIHQGDTAATIQAREKANEERNQHLKRMLTQQVMNDLFLFDRRHALDDWNKEHNDNPILAT